MSGFIHSQKTNHLNILETLFHRGKPVGTLRISEYGVTFQPSENWPKLMPLGLKTWETPESARIAIHKACSQLD